LPIKADPDGIYRGWKRREVGVSHPLGKWNKQYRREKLILTGMCT